MVFRSLSKLQFYFFIPKVFHNFLKHSGEQFEFHILENFFPQIKKWTYILVSFFFKRILCVSALLAGLFVYTHAILQRLEEDARSP